MTTGQSSSRTIDFPSTPIRYTEWLAIAAVFLYGGQDLMRGEPAALGIPAWVFASGFFGYAIFLAAVSDRTRARVVLTGGIPLGIGLFHLVESYQGGFYMPVAYAALVFGSATIMLFAAGWYSNHA